MTTTRDLIDEMLDLRLDDRGREWLAEARADVANGLPHARFAALLSLASRWIPRGGLAPDPEETAAAASALPGWNPERWTLLEAARVSLVLARPDLAADDTPAALEEAFRYADMGELCALYRSLAHLPGPERFVWRAGEGCRTNMTAVFEAVACDTPFPARHFDEVAWRQLVIKAVFVGAPLWRVYGLDDRVDSELARMALDLAEERRSAGRSVQPELWLCVGEHGGERGLASIERELDGTDTLGRRAAAVALARAGHADRLRARLSTETDPEVRATMEAALSGPTDQTAFQDLHPDPNAAPA